MHLVGCARLVGQVCAQTVESAATALPGTYAPAASAHGVVDSMHVRWCAVSSVGAARRCRRGRVVDRLRYGHRADRVGDDGRRLRDDGRVGLCLFATCAAPTSLPGSTVNVTLGDMGMTQMMGGVAPLGGHMMLQAAPATVPGGQVSLVVSNTGWADA